MKRASFRQAMRVLENFDEAKWKEAEGPLKTFLENWGTIRDLVMAMYEGDIDPGRLSSLLIKWRIVERPFTITEWPINCGCMLSNLADSIKQLWAEEPFSYWDFAAFKPTIKPVAQPTTYEVLLWQPCAGVSVHEIRTRMFEERAFANVALFLCWLAQGQGWALDQFAYAHRLMTIPDEDHCYYEGRSKSCKHLVPSFGPGGSVNSDNDEPHFLRLEDPDELEAHGKLGKDTVFVAFREVSK